MARRGGQITRESIPATDTGSWQRSIQNRWRHTHRSHGGRLTSGRHAQPRRSNTSGLDAVNAARKLTPFRHDTPGSVFRRRRHPGAQRPQPHRAETTTGMGRADGLASPQDPRRLPRLPRSHPLQRKRFTADPMSTGEPDATETGTSGSGRGRRKRSSTPEPPRRRPTSRHARMYVQPVIMLRTLSAGRGSPGVTRFLR